MKSEFNEAFESLFSNSQTKLIKWICIWSTIQLTSWYPTLWSAWLTFDIARAANTDVDTQYYFRGTNCWFSLGLDPPVCWSAEAPQHQYHFFVKHVLFAVSFFNYKDASSFSWWMTSSNTFDLNWNINMHR